MNHSFWIKETAFNKADVAIVGAGLLGLWTAYELKKRAPALGVIILEKNWPPAGASLRNAGFACFGSPSELLCDLENMGEKHLWQTTYNRIKGIEKLKTFCKQQGIAYSPCGGHECFIKSDANQDKVNNQLHYLNSQLQQLTGKKNYFSQASKKLKSNGLTQFDQLIYTRHEGALNSGELYLALQKKVLKAGVNILYNTEVTSYKAANKGIEISTHNEQVFSTNKLLYTTNAWLSLQKKQVLVVPARGQIIISPPIKSLALNGGFHFNKGYVYFRNIQNRILIGGFRNTDVATETTLELAPNIGIQEKLYQFLQDHFTKNTIPPFTQFSSWQGTMAFSKTHEPLLQKLDTQVWAAMCCNGMGVALSPIFSETIAHHILQH